LFNTFGYTVGAEIGVGSGIYSEIICQQVPGVKLYCVDLWKTYPGIVDFDNDEYLEKDRKSATMRLAGCDVIFMQMYSMDAVKLFGPGSLDFVYIDANHWDPFITDDIREWSRVVRSGGIVSGHDYHHEHRHVVDAVDNYAKEHDINPYFIVGETDSGNYPENIPSWFWVKP
jgi:SAM-dependent methyltransferase